MPPGVVQYCGLGTLKPLPLWQLMCRRLSWSIIGFSVISRWTQMWPCSCMFLSGKEVDRKGMTLHLMLWKLTLLCAVCGYIWGSLSLDSKAYFVPMIPLTLFLYEQNYLVQTYQEIFSLLMSTFWPTHCIFHASLMPLFPSTSVIYNIFF